MADDLELYEDVDAGFSLRVPRDWEYVDQPATEVRFVAVEPLADQGFRTNVVVTVDELPDGLGLGAWQDGVDELMPSMMDGWLLIDRLLEPVAVQGSASGSGTQSIVRLGHHVVNQGTPVTLRQIAQIRGSRGVTFSTSVWTPAYSARYALISAIEGSFSLVAGDEDPRP